MKHHSFLFTAGAVLICTVAGIAHAADFLEPNQVKTISSVTSLENRHRDFFEITYTADYRLDEFIAAVTAGKLEYGEDMRTALHNVIAPRSPLVPKNRLSNHVPGCSSAIAQDKQTGSWLIGRNYDLDVRSNGTTCVIHTAPKGGFKSVGLADTAQIGLSKNAMERDRELVLYAPYVTMDGVNEKGFAIAIMLLEKARVVQNESGRKSLPSSLVVRYLLDHAESVPHAIALLQAMNIKPDYLLNTRTMQDLVGDNISFHWAIADASGNRAILEYVNGTLNVITNPVHAEYSEKTQTITHPGCAKPFLLSTNFHLSKEVGLDANNAGNGLWRYSTLEKALEKNATPRKSELAGMMQSVRYFMNDEQAGHGYAKEGKDPANPNVWEWMTIWTDILDTREKTITLYYREDYSREYTFGIERK